VLKSAGLATPEMKQAPVVKRKVESVEGLGSLEAARATVDPHRVAV